MEKTMDNSTFTLTNFSDSIASWLKSIDVNSIYSKYIETTSDDKRKILNISLDFSFQSDRLDDNIKLTIQDVTINSHYISKWKDGQWEICK